MGSIIKTADDGSGSTLLLHKQCASKLDQGDSLSTFICHINHSPIQKNVKPILMIVKTRIEKQILVFMTVYMCW